MTWRQTGDAGDCVFTLALLHHLGGKHILRMVDRPGIVPTPWTPRVPLIKELFEAQPYVEKVEISEEECDIDLTRFRNWHGATTTLIAAQISEYQQQAGDFLDIDGSRPWMTVEPDESFKGRIVIARSPRYQNTRAPWKEVVEHYGKRLAFVGLPQEHADFCQSFGRVDHFKTKTLMDVAKAIAGADLFIGNQSSPHAIALALGVDMISEVSDIQPDCIYPRDNVQYVCSGACTLPDIAGSGVREVPAVPDIPPSFNTSTVPPGYWQYPGLPPGTHFKLQRDLVKQLENCSVEEAEKRLFHHNVLRVSSFFHGSVNDPLGLFKQAYASAFPKERA